MKLSGFVLMAVVSAGLVACGDDGTEDATDEPAQTGPQALNGCGSGDFVELGEQEAVVRIAAEGLSFSPPCVAIAAGQTLRFEGSLTAHPIAPGNADDPEAGSPLNPITATSSGSSVEFTFENTGTYAYYCELHSFGAGTGMAGAVYVR